jgi:signal transduction histidine kinase
MELDLRQAQKLESMGRLAAGIAHEINTPIQYVGDSVHYLGQAITDILSLLDKSRADLRTLAAQRGGAAAVAELAREEEAVDLEYLRREGPLAVERIVDGISRVARIVHAMKTFSHPGSDSAIPMDINKMVENTLIIAGHELKSVGRVATELAELPQVSGFPADINQALLNLVVNAAHAVADRGDPASPGVVTVGTRANQGYVEITVADNGCGMTPEVQARLFEPFFTTKEVGRGTGQGLGVARAAAQKHDGAISFVSSVDVGTTFTLRLPIEGTT